jgi:beta-xylosidase
MRAEMDFGDIGRFLSPKPMMFLSGTTDHLFPKVKVEEAYEKLRSHYHNAPHNLQTLFFEGGHHCGTDVQKTIIGYFDKQIGSMYKNPVIYADYSDPDICRVGDDYYMTSSSFNHFPGLQILHSTDLVNWELIGAALTDYPGPGWNECIRAEESFAIPQHGCGVWAPAIRYHDGEFYIYCGDPDRGIFMVKTKDPRGRWDDPVWLVKAKGYIDPCPLWDSQGRAWLTHGCAGSRAGLKSVLFIAEMTPDGCSLKEPSRIIYDGHKTQPTIEGTKFYEYQGDYYIFSPAGGVKTGWQTVLRSSDPYGPYQERVVMAQGATDINGPHQGGWVETQNGEFWFVHFQDKDSYGRIVHLQPMHWKDGWPVIGVDDDGDGVGNPVNSFKRPDLPFSGVKRPYESDEFDGTTLGLQWQWPALPSPYWYYCNAAESRLKLYSVQQPEGWKNLWDTPNLLMQKFPAADFTTTTKTSFVPNPQLAPKGENCGLVVMGDSYANIRLTDAADGIKLQLIECVNAHKGAAETVLFEVPVQSEELPVPFSNAYMSTTVPPVKPLEYKECVVYMRTEIRNTPKEGDVPDALCTFSYSLDGENWHKIQVDGNEYEFKARPGRWIGAKVGLYCNRHHPKNDSGWMEADWFRISRQNLK